MVGILESPIPIEPIAAVGPVLDAAGPKRIKRLERPSKVTLDEDVAKVFNEIDGFQTRIAEIKTMIDSKQQNKQLTSAEVQEARNRLNELTLSFRKVMDEKKAIREELDHADKLREKMRADARSIRDKLPYVRVEQIDEEVKKLEYRMSHTSLTLQEEKKLLQQVKDLTKSRDSVKDYNDRLEQITQDEGSRGEILDKIREKDAILNDLRAKQDEQRKVFAQIKEKDASHSLDIPALIEERNVAYEKIRVLRDQVKEIKAEFRNKEEEYWERERQWKEQQALQRRKDYEKRESDRKEREKIRKQRELENYVEPYTDEIIMVDQLSSYLQKYAPAVEEAAAAASSAAAQKAEIVAPKGVGTVLVSKKNKFDEETDSWFSGKGKGKKAKAPAAQKNKGKEKLSLSLDALTSFEKFKLSPPTTVGDVTKSIDDLKLKREEFLNLQDEARKRRERGEPEPKPAKEEPVIEVVETPVEGPTFLAEPTPAEARNGVMKVENVLPSEKTEEVLASDATENGEVKAEEHKESKLPEDLEAKLPEAKLPTDLEATIPTDLDSKLPTDLGSKLPRGLDSKLPTDLDSKLPTDLDSKLPADLDSKLPTDLDSKLPMDLDSKLPTDLDSKLPTDLDSKLPTDLDSKLSTDLEAKLPEDLGAKLPGDIEAEHPEEVTV